MRWWILLIIPVLIVIFLNTRPARAAQVDTTKVVLHHTAGNKETDRDLTVSEIDRYHKQRGWDGIGYHFVIRKNGQICKGRKITKLGAHAKGRNNYVGVALTGYDNFTQAQKDSLVQLLHYLGAQQVEPHHEQCPGPGLKGFYAK